MNGDNALYSKFSVLIVEDNEVNQKVTSAMLMHFGIKADIAENGQLAIEKAKQTGYDLILMDCQMPVMNGMDATKAIRNFNESQRTKPDVTIIAMTANASKDDVQSYYDAGMDDFAPKPVELEIVQGILYKWLS
ncbi:MAG: response regulator [Gammaproteobacteria bacterium]|nr:response regulator [Gammaproteobacteria bacterium]